MVANILVGLAGKHVLAPLHVQTGNRNGLSGGLVGAALHL